MFPIPFNFPFRKKDGSVTTIDAAISGGGTPYTLPTASVDTKGGVKIGAGLTMDGETLKNSNPTPYSLPTASADSLGGVKIGSGLSINDGVLSASGGGGGITADTWSVNSESDTSGIYGGTFTPLEGKIPICATYQSSESSASDTANAIRSVSVIQISNGVNLLWKIAMTSNGSGRFKVKGTITVYYIDDPTG